MPGLMLDTLICYIYYATKFFQQPCEVDIIVFILYVDRHDRTAPLPLGKLWESAQIFPLVGEENLHPPQDRCEVISGCSFRAYSMMTEKYLQVDEKKSDKTQVIETHRPVALNSLGSWVCF